MSQKALSRWLYAIILLVALSMAGIYLVLILSPRPGLWGEAFEASALRLPFTVFFALTALPIALALIYAWLVARNIGLDRSFSRPNASHLRAISVLAAVDGVYYLLGNLVFYLLAPESASFPLFQIMLSLFAFIASVAAAALSHLVLKAAELQEQNDLTI